MKRVAAISCLLLLFAACKKDAAPTEQVTPKAEPEGAKVEWSAPITWNAVDGTALGVPMVEVAVRDRATRLVVDTASKYNTLTRSFATEVRVPVSETKQVTRVQGKLDRAVKVEGVVGVHFGGNEWRLQDVVAAEGLPQTDAWGIGGLVAPMQFVTPGTSLVMDFRGGEVYLVSGGDQHFSDWFGAKFGKPVEMRAMADEDGLIYVQTSVNPETKDPVIAVLDTGTAHSRFTEALMQVKPTEDECVEGLDPFAGCIPGRVVENASIEFGGNWYGSERVAALPIVFGHPKMKAQGALGMDVLQRCTIALTASTEHIWVVCDPK